MEPWGEAGKNYRTACLMAQLQGLLSSSKKPIRVGDIMKKWFAIRKEQTPEQMVSIAKRIGKNG